MRALVLLLLVVVSFLLVVRFYPTTPVEGAGSQDGAPAVAGPAGSAGSEERLPQGFLSPRETERPRVTPAESTLAPEPVATAPSTPSPAVSSAKTRTETASEDAASTVPGWLAHVQPPQPRDEGELLVAAALVHGDVGDVTRAARSSSAFPASRARMAEAFALAMSGRLREGLDLAAGLDEVSLTRREKELLQAALGAEAPALTVVEASDTESPLVLAMEMALRARDGAEHLEARRYGPAARAYSDVLLAELDAPWPADHPTLAEWTKALEEAQERNRWSTKGEWPGVEMVVESGDSAIAIRKRFLDAHPGAVMCAGLILRANGVRGYLQPNQTLRVPTDPMRMLVDLDARWALCLAGGEVVGSWPVGIGREGEETPRGEYVTGNKLENPPWMPTGKEPIPFGDPRNPLGTRWIGWFEDGVKTSYGFHGTKEPNSVGTPSSDGCIRFLNDDVEELFEILPEGAAVLVR